MDEKIGKDIFTKIKNFNSNIKIEYGPTIRAPNKEKTDKTDRYFFRISIMRKIKIYCFKLSGELL